jgi:hypothetical protein
LRSDLSFAETAEQKTPEPQKTPAAAARAVITVADVATRATEVANLLRTFSTKLAPSAQIEAIGTSLPLVSADIDRQLAVTMKTLREQPTLEILQAEQQLWEQKQVRMSTWLNLLTARATQLNGALKRIADLKKTWTRSQKAAESSKAPEPILQQIGGTIAAIESVQFPLQAQLTRVLDIQSRVAREVERCQTVSAEVDLAQKTVVSGILEPDRPPVWSAELWAEAQTSAPENIRRVAAAYEEGIIGYARDSSKRVLLFAGLFVLLALIFITAGRRVRRWAAAGQVESAALMVFAQPYAAALMSALILATSPWNTHLSTTVKLSLQTVVVIPTILLVQPVMNPLMVPGLYALGVLFAVDIVRQSFLGLPLIGQALIVMESLSGIIATGWLLGKLRRLHGDVEKLAKPQLFWLVARVVLLCFTIGLVAGAMGYMRLARLVTPGILSGGTLALAFYASVRVPSGMAALTLRVWPLNALRMVLHHRGLIEKLAYRLFLWIALGGWVTRYLDYVGFLEPTLSLGKVILTAKIERGSVSISLEDVR